MTRTTKTLFAEHLSCQKYNAIVWDADLLLLILENIKKNNVSLRKIFLNDMESRGMCGVSLGFVFLFDVENLMKYAKG